MRIRIADYQALADVDLEATGLTVITGPSNIGKSAILRAITGAVFGRGGDYYIRNGQHSTSVHLHDTDFDLKWAKTNKPTTTRQTALEVNGTVHTKLGREHWKLTQELGMFGIPTTYKEFRPQFAEQGSPPFLLMENDTVVAELMKKVARADVTTKATSMAKKEGSDTSQRIKTRKEDLAAAQALLDELNGLPRIIADHDKLTKDYQCLLNKETTTSRLTGLLHQLEALRPSMVPPDPPRVVHPVNIQYLESLERLHSLAPVDVPTDPSPIRPPDGLLNQRSLVEVHQALGRQIEALAVEIDGLVGDLETLDNRKKELEKELGTCPLCERSFNEHA